MFEIEYGADSHDITIRPDEWDMGMATISQDLADNVDRGLITAENFEQGMEWLTGVVIDDEGVRVPATFGDLTIAVTRTA